MPHEAQQFEQAIAMAFTCRSVIKYASSLSEEQKNELIADIDTSLQFLEDRLIAKASVEAKMALSPLQLAEAISVGESDHDSSVAEDHTVSGGQTLRGLYKIYRTYLSMEQGKGTDAFIARYNKAMSIMDEVQKIVEKSRDVYPSHVYVEDLLHSIRGFITDLYVLFTEFTSAITSVLQGNDFSMDTEELSSMQKHHAESDKQADLQDLAPLKKIHERHLRLDKRKGTVASRVSDATAFLIFLQDSLGHDFNKRAEIIAQLNTAAKLLSDLSQLVADYENTASVLLEPQQQQ